MSHDHTAKYELKKLKGDGLDAAFEKVERYRLLNEPRGAESICRDILEIEPENQRALVSLLLSLTDQFKTMRAGILVEARGLISQLSGDFEKAYYAGVIAERHGIAQLDRHKPGTGKVAFNMLTDAMKSFEEAERLSPSRNENARLRWNACARTIMDDDSIGPDSGDDVQTTLE